MKRLSKYVSCIAKIPGKNVCHWCTLNGLHTNSDSIFVLFNLCAHWARFSIWLNHLHKLCMWLVYRLTVEITKLVNEMKNGQENESHLSLQLTSERKGMDMASKSLTKCEMLLKKFIDKNEELKCENDVMNENVRFCSLFMQFLNWTCF